MAEDRGKGKREGGRKRRRAKDRHFMDAALDAFIRDQALLLWRDLIVYRDREGQPPDEALRQCGYFGDKGDYQRLWSDHWESAVLAMPSREDGEIFESIEAAVRAAVLEEKAQRSARGEPALEDTEDYNTFVRQTLNKLLTEAAAETDS